MCVTRASSTTAAVRATTSRCCLSREVASLRSVCPAGTDVLAIGEADGKRLPQPPGGEPCELVPQSLRPHRPITPAGSGGRTGQMRRSAAGQRRSPAVGGARTTGTAETSRLPVPAPRPESMRVVAVRSHVVALLDCSSGAWSL